MRKNVPGMSFESYASTILFLSKYENLAKQNLKKRHKSVFKLKMV